MKPSQNQNPRVIIVGAGFGGLQAAKKLARKNVRVTVIDRTNYHLFQPLLYQVATAALSPADIAAPVRSVLSEFKNVEVILAEVESVDVAAKKVKTPDLEFDYDYLILATGARHSYFGHNDWEKLAPGLKSLEDAIELRRRILMAFEYAEKIDDEAARRAAMTFVIIGGGPTGVEMAGAIAEISRYTLARDFRHINPSEARVILIEGMPRLLAAYLPDLSESARKQLVDLGSWQRCVVRWENSRRTCRSSRSRRCKRGPHYSRTFGSPGNWRLGEFSASDWGAVAGNLTSGNATRTPCSAQCTGYGKRAETATFPLLGQGNDGHDWAQQSGRRFK